jgi:hypothetical protein
VNTGKTENEDGNHVWVFLPTVPFMMSLPWVDQPDTTVSLRQKATNKVLLTVDKKMLSEALLEFCRGQKKKTRGWRM